MKMTTGRAIWTLARYRSGLYLLNFGIWTLFYVVPLSTGLITKSFFDGLSGKEQAGLNVWALIGLLVGLSTARVFFLLAGMISWSGFWYTIEALLRKNMMGWLVLGPGARTLHGSPGEAVSTFRALNDTRRRAALLDNLMTQLLDSFNMNTISLATGLILLLAAQGMRAGTFTVGDFALFVSYVGGVAAAPRWVGRLVARHKQ